jgi:hypothetical protein
MEKHQHHKQPRSRGGSDDPFNLVDLDPYAHAIHHAEDFLYNDGPRFDFRHEAWPLLPPDLQEKVLRKAAEHSSKMNRGRKQNLSEGQRQRRRALQKTAAEANKGRKRSPESREKMRQARLRYLEEHGPYEVKHSEETKRKQSEAAKRRAECETPEERDKRLASLAKGRQKTVDKWKNEQT